LTLIIITTLAIFCWIYVLWGKSFLASRRRGQLQNVPLTEQQQLLLNHAMPLYRRLPTPLRRQLDGHIQVFLAEKLFIGADDFKITDNMRLLIAANACLLLLNRHSDYFTNVKSIVLYPSAYRAPQSKNQHGLVTQSSQTRLGESWPWGTIVLSWTDSLAGSADEQDGHNVILHEFAHQLDQQNGGATGTPKLGDKTMYAQWNNVFSKEYHQLKNQLNKHRNDVIEPYGATNEAEFFAVVTESFFEKPLALRQKHSALYELLYRYYQVDPVSWFK